MPNIIIITTHDTGRHFGCYGVDTVHTPAIDAIADDGFRFTNYFTARKTHSQRALALGSRRELASVVLQGLLNLRCGALAWWHIAQGNVGGEPTKIIRSLTA